MPPRLRVAVAAVTAATVMLVGCTNSAERDEPDETSPSNGRCSPNGCSSGVAATLRPR